MISGQGEWHRLRKLFYEKRKSEKERVNKRKTKIIMGGKSGYQKIVKLLKRSYDGLYRIGVTYEEEEFIVEMSLALGALQ